MDRSRRQAARLLLAVVAAIVPAVTLAACSGSSPGQSAQRPHPAPTPTCPSVTPAPHASGPAVTRALQNLPFGLPIPDGISVVGTTTTSDGVHVVRFTTATSLRTSVIFMVERYPKAGYVIGRGDAEATEADAPFVHGQVRGLARITELQPCQTLWTVASVAVTGNGVTSPLLVPHPTSSVTSALPFG